MFQYPKLGHFGNDTIDRYPLDKGIELKKILILKEEILEILKKEFSVFQEIYKKKQNKTTLTIPDKKTIYRTQTKQQRIYHEFEPSNIHYAGVYNIMCLND